MKQIPNFLTFSTATFLLSACSPENTVFLGEFLANPSAIGAIAPSSEELSACMTEQITDADGIVLELGAGTGPFTQKLVNQLSKDNLYIVENNLSFAKHLKERFPNNQVLCIDACELDQHIPKHLHGKIRTVISGLPFRSLPADVAAKILVALKKVCSPDVKLIQFTYFNEPPLPQEGAQSLNLTPHLYKEAPNNVPAAYVWQYTTPK